MDSVGLTPELIASGLVGLVMSGIVARGAIMGFLEARAKMKESEKIALTSPAVAIASAIWDKDQVERFLQYMEHIGEVLEMQAKYTEQIARAQGILSDNFQQSTQSKLNDLLDILEKKESGQHRPRPRPRKKT